MNAKMVRDGSGRFVRKDTDEPTWEMVSEYDHIPVGIQGVHPDVSNGKVKRFSKKQREAYAKKHGFKSS